MARNNESTALVQQIQHVLRDVHTIIIDRDMGLLKSVTLKTNYGELTVGGRFCQEVDIWNDVILEARRKDREELDRELADMAKSTQALEPANMTE